MTSTEFNLVCGCIDKATEKLRGKCLRSEEFEQVQRQLNLLMKALYTTQERKGK